MNLSFFRLFTSHGIDPQMHRLLEMLSLDDAAFEALDGQEEVAGLRTEGMWDEMRDLRFSAARYEDEAPAMSLEARETVQEELALRVIELARRMFGYIPQGLVGPRLLKKLTKEQKEALEAPVAAPEIAVEREAAEREMTGEEPELVLAPVITKILEEPKPQAPTNEPHTPRPEAEPAPEPEME